MDCAPASGSCGWFHMRPEISTANDVVLTDVSQLFFSGFQQTLLHTECNPNRNFKLSLITLTTPGGHMSRKWAIYWKLSICVHTKSLHLNKVTFPGRKLVLSGHQLWNQHWHLLGRKGACIFVFLEQIYLVLITFFLIIFCCLPRLAWPNVWGRWTHCSGGQIEKLGSERKKILSHGKRFEGNRSRKVLLSIGRRGSGLASVHQSQMLLVF